MVMSASVTEEALQRTWRTDLGKRRQRASGTNRDEASLASSSGVSGGCTYVVGNIVYSGGEIFSENAGTRQSLSNVT
jgi:hypothetical protein